MRTATTVFLALGLLALLAAVYLRARPEGSSAATPGTDGDRGAEQVADQAASQREVADAAFAPPAESSELEPAAPRPVRVTRPIAVRVHDDAGRPQAGFEVRFPGRGRTGEPAPAGRTGADGRCALDLERWTAGELRLVQVSDPAGAPRFSAPCVLEPELLIVLPPAALALRGELVTDPPLALAQGNVAAYALASGAQSVGQFQARGSIDAQGRFELGVARALEHEVLRLEFHAGGKALGSADVPVAELLAPEGATVTLRLTRLRLQVHDPRGEPIEGARVHAEALADDGGYAPFEAETDAAGAALLLVPRAAVEIGVGKEGWSAAVLVLEDPPIDLEERLTLRPLTAHDVVEGVVVDAAEQPVEAAFVTLAADGRSSAPFHATFRGTRTGADGRFRLATAGDAPFKLGASHARLGMTERLVLQPPAGFVTLRFTAAGSLRVHVRTAGLDPENRAAMLEHALLDGAGEVVDAGHHGRGTLVELTGLEAGERVLHVLLRGRNALGTTRVSVLAGVTTECEVELVQGAELSARVLDEQGGPVGNAHVLVLDPALPAAVRQLWSRATSDADGRFRVFASAPRGCETEVRAQDGRSWRGLLAPGAAQSVVVR